ncbi:MAG: hypothetical protein U1E66_05420 [Rhodospirillales bacterium]
MSRFASHLGRLAQRRLIRSGAGFALALFGCFWSAGANAQVILFSANSGEQSFTGSSYVDFNGSASGGVKQSFATSSANQRVSIVFDATCYVQGSDSYAVVTVLVDPAGSVGEFAAPPTDNVSNNGVVFCFHESGTIFNNAVRSSVVASVAPALAGTHTVRVRVRMGSLLGDPGAQATLQAISLTVLR